MSEWHKWEDTRPTPHNDRISILIVFVEPFHDTGNAHIIKLLLEGLLIAVIGIDVFEAIDEGVTMATPATIAIANELTTPQW